MFIKDQFTQSEQLVLMFQAVEAARNGIVITDPSLPDNPIIYTNPAFTDITGYNAEEILGHNCRFLQGNDRAQPDLNQLRLAVKEGRAITTILRNYRKDGKLFFNELTISPVRSLNGEVQAFIGIQNDITSRVEAEERISEFYSVVSHELRTPIAKIKSSLDIVAEGEAGPINESVQRFIDISKKAADSLWRMLENILDFKKLESGKFRLMLQRIDLAQLVESTVADFQPVAKGASINIKCLCTSRPAVEADGQRLIQVLENLLSNAVKFSPPNSDVTVKLSQRERSRVRVEITDAGPGISAEDQVRLFKKFQQLEAPDRRSRGGTGLGLAVCRAIMDAHGGTVGVDSREGHGSTFWLELAVIG